MATCFLYHGLTTKIVTHYVYSKYRYQLQQSNVEMGSRERYTEHTPPMVVTLGIGNLRLGPTKKKFSHLKT